MFNVEFGSQPQRFLNKAEKEIAARIIGKIEKLSIDPFPSDVKRIVNRKEKVFRIRVGDYRIQYLVIYEKNLLFISNIKKKPQTS